MIPHQMLTLLYWLVEDICLLTEVLTQELHHWLLENTDRQIKTCSKALFPWNTGLLRACGPQARPAWR